MTGYPGEFHEGVLSVNDVQVRAADAGVSHIDLDLAASRLRGRDLGQAEFKRCCYLKRFHRITPARTQRPDFYSY